MWGHEIEDVSIGRNGLIERVIWRNLYPPEEVEEDVEPVPTIGSISCAALLCCNDQQCDKDVFCAINDSGLVFDGGLVVDNVSYSATKNSVDTY